MYSCICIRICTFEFEHWSWMLDARSSHGHCHWRASAFRCRIYAPIRVLSSPSPSPSFRSIVSRSRSRSRSVSVSTCWLAYCLRHVVLASASVLVCSRRPVICRRAHRAPFPPAPPSPSLVLRGPHQSGGLRHCAPLSEFWLSLRVYHRQFWSVSFSFSLVAEVSLLLCSRFHALLLFAHFILCSSSPPVARWRCCDVHVRIRWRSRTRSGLRYCALFSLAAQHALLDWSSRRSLERFVRTGVRARRHSHFCICTNTYF